MAIKFYNNQKSLEIAISLVKEAKEATLVKMSSEVIKYITTTKVVDSINGEETVSGGVNLYNKARLFGFELGLKVAINVNLIAGYYENEGMEKARLEALKVVRHEYFHCFQYVWLWKKGGENAIKKAKMYEHNTPYRENLLEKGAWAYEDPNHASIQNFAKDFAIFLA